MFVIDQSKIQKLMENQERTYVDRVIDFLQKEFSNAAAMERTDLTEPVSAQVGKAVGYGLETEYQSCIYVMSAWIFGVDFDLDFPAATEVLNHPHMPADDKTDWLVEWSQTMLDTLTEREA